MPAVITHDMFGQDVLDAVREHIGDSLASRDAFMLGNQGPDVFFFGNLNPRIAKAWGIGTRMHREKPDELLAGLAGVARDLIDKARPTGQAYAQGMFCHYLLDSKMHPFIYAQQNEICDAGIDDLDRQDGHEVHAEIESDLDVLVLTAKTGRTIADFEPSKTILLATDETLQIISYMMKRTAKEVYGIDIPKDAFAQSVKAYRATLAAIYSPRGVKRTVLGRLEKLARRHSFVQAMSHKNELLHSSPFENAEHAEWVNPETGIASTDSFWDIYNAALASARALVPRFPSATPEAVSRITQGLDFNGAPTRPLIVSVEDVA